MISVAAQTEKLFINHYNSYQKLLYYIQDGILDGLLASLLILSFLCQVLHIFNVLGAVVVGSEDLSNDMYIECCCAQKH